MRQLFYFGHLPIASILLAASTALANYSNSRAQLIHPRRNGEPTRSTAEAEKQTVRAFVGRHARRLKYRLTVCDVPLRSNAMTAWGKAWGKAWGNVLLCSNAFAAWWIFCCEEGDGDGGGDVRMAQ